MSEIFPEHYEIEARGPFEMNIATAAVASCELCAAIVSGMGGGSPIICKPCGDALLSGKLRGCVKWDKE